MATADTAAVESKSAETDQAERRTIRRSESACRLRAVRRKGRPTGARLRRLRPCPARSRRGRGGRVFGQEDQEQDMRKIIEAIVTIVTIVIAAAFIWLVLSAPGFSMDEASTVPIAAQREVRR